MKVRGHFTEVVSHELKLRAPGMQIVLLPAKPIHRHGYLNPEACFPPKIRVN